MSAEEALTRSAASKYRVLRYAKSQRAIETREKSGEGRGPKAGCCEGCGAAEGISRPGGGKAGGRHEGGQDFQGREG